MQMALSPALPIAANRLRGGLLLAQPSQLDFGVDLLLPPRCGVLGLLLLTQCIELLLASCVEAFVFKGLYGLCIVCRAAPGIGFAFHRLPLGLQVFCTALCLQPLTVEFLLSLE